ncbi:MAG TPA: IS66 family transposase [Clostridiales bacterium]|nr:IS66 family transposase [Clostridiales bacterium]
MISREEYDKLIDENQKMQKQIQWLMETIKLKNNKIFGSSSEKTSQEESDQISIFNEAEVESNLTVPEPELEEVKAHYRKKRSKKDRLPEDLPVEEIEYTLSEEEQVCPICNEKLHVIGKETVREELKIIPAKAVIVRHVRYSYACRNCEKTNTEVPVIKAPVPNAVIRGGFASPEAVAYIITQKYLMDIPLYRQEQDFKRKDILLSRQTMSNWIIKSSHMWLEPIYRKLHERLVASEVIHADETILQVLKEPGKKPQSKSYMWLYRTGQYEKYQIALYKYERSRSTKHAEEYLKGFSGYLHCDGYQGYKNIKNAVIVQCFAHARRKFDEALNCLKTEERKTSKAMIGYEYCNKLFEIERNIKELSPEEKLKKRQELSRPILDEFLVWLKSLNPAKQSHLGNAVNYTLNNWENLNNYMLDGRLSISNNSAEHLAKSFALCRKNFLFSNTPKGADSSALAMSMVETAKINNIDAYEYLTYIFKNAPQLDLEKEENIEKLLPEAFKNEKKKDS